MEWACVLCGCHIQSDWASRATNLHQILHWAWTLLLGNYLDDSEGHSYGQLVICQFIMTMLPLMHHVSRRVLGKTPNHPGYLFPLQPIFYALLLLAFPKTKITSERPEIQTISEIHNNMTRQLLATWGTVWGPKMPTFKRTEASLSSVQCFLYLVSSSINVSISHSTWVDTFWTHLV